MTNIKNKDR